MNGELARIEQFPAAAIAERPDEVVARIRQARELVVKVQSELMKPGVHYGIIPGTDKPTLLKDGAELLNQAFRLSAREEEVADLSTEDERKYKVTLGLYDAAGRRLGFGVGVCSTSEEKYRWRKAYKNEFDASPVERRRSKEYPRRDGSAGMDVTYQIRTEPADLENTVLQMATKRALVQATRQVHAISDVFADITLEDLPEELRDQLLLGGRNRVKKPQPKKAASPPPQQQPAETTTRVEREPGSDDGRLISKEQWAPVLEAWHTRGTISLAQSKRLFAIAKGAGWDGRQLDAEIEAGTGAVRDSDGAWNLPSGQPYELTVAIFSHGPQQ